MVRRFDLTEFESAPVSFQSKVEVDEASGCWLWTAHLDRKGYGRYVHERGSLAHRFSYEHFVGPIPDGLHIDHLCCVTRCVNPDHLDVVTNLENARRQVARTTACPHDHEYTEINTYWYDGHRRCRTCRRINERARLARLKDTAALYAVEGGS